MKSNRYRVLFWKDVQAQSPLASWIHALPTEERALIVELFWDLHYGGPSSRPSFFKQVEGELWALVHSQSPTCCLYFGCASSNIVFLLPAKDSAKDTKELFMVKSILKKQESLKPKDPSEEAKPLMSEMEFSELDYRACLTLEHLEKKLIPIDHLFDIHTRAQDRAHLRQKMATGISKAMVRYMVDKEICVNELKKELTWGKDSAIKMIQGRADLTLEDLVEACLITGIQIGIKGIYKDL